ncbi:RNA polymerase sigma factor [Micromonosporaceae bacterium Da 78-11]
MSLSETELTQRFTVLYDAYYSQIYGYAVSRTDHQRADEIVSDTFMVAWRRFDDMPDPPLPWLLGVARNVVREQARRSARQESVEADLRTWTSAVEPVATDPADVVTDRAGVLGALQRLSTDDRELLTLVAWHGLSPAEAAEVIGCSTATYSVRLHRARGRLQHAMAHDSDPHHLHNISPVTAIRKGATR